MCEYCEDCFDFCDCDRCMFLRQDMEAVNCDCAFDVSWEHNSNCPKYDGPVTRKLSDIYDGPKNITQAPDWFFNNITQAPDWFFNAAHAMIASVVIEAQRVGGVITTPHINDLWAATLDGAHALDRLPEYGLLLSKVNTLEDDLVTERVARRTAQRKVREYRIQLGLNPEIGLDMTVERTTTRKMETASRGTLSLTTKSHGHHVLSVSNGSTDQREASSGSTYLDDDALRNLFVLLSDAMDDLDD